MFNKLKSIFTGDHSKEESPTTTDGGITEGNVKSNVKEKPKRGRPAAPKGQTPTEAPPAPTPKAKRKSKKVREEKNQPTPKEIATANNEPYVTIVSMDIDPNDINNGTFELDWNDKFVLNLIKAGYQKNPADTDADIIDRWFTNVCRSVVLELYEQEQADPYLRAHTRVVNQRDIGNGRTEIS